MNTKIASALSAVPRGDSGFARRMRNAEHVRRVAAVGKLFAEATHGDAYATLAFHDIMGGRAPRGRTYEAVSTSDFPILFGDFLSRSLAMRYKVIPTVWQMFAARQVNRDFRPTKVIDFTGGGGKLDVVPEYAPFPERSFAESEFETLLGKFGNRVQWSWESAVNDDLGAFARAPQALAQGARSTEDYVATSVLVDSAGWRTALFGSVDNKPLTADNLEAAYQSIADVVDEDGNPIDIGDPVLMVPMGLNNTAQNIINTTEIRRTVAGVERLTVGNSLSVNPKVVVNRWMNTIRTDGNKATSWALLPDPNSIRPAVIETFLRGYEEPDLRVKSDAGMTLGGQQISPDEGSFDRDSVEYRIRHVVGGNKGFDDAVYASNGA